MPFQAPPSPSGKKFAAGDIEKKFTSTIDIGQKGTDYQGKKWEDKIRATFGGRQGEDYASRLRQFLNTLNSSIDRVSVAQSVYGLSEDDPELAQMKESILSAKEDLNNLFSGELNANKLSTAFEPTYEGSLLGKYEKPLGDFVTKYPYYSDWNAYQNQPGRETFMGKLAKASPYIMAAIASAGASGIFAPAGAGAGAGAGQAGGLAELLKSANAVRTLGAAGTNATFSGALSAGAGAGAGATSLDQLLNKPSYNTSGITGSQGGTDIGSLLGEAGTQATTQGGNMSWLDTLLDAPSYYDQIGGLSLPSEVGGAGWGMDSLMNIGDYLGGGGGASEIYPGVTGLEGILDPLTGEYGQSGLNITDILKNIGGAGGGIDLQSIIKKISDAKKIYDKVAGGDEQPAGGDGASLSDMLQKLLGGGTGTAGAGGGTYYPTTEMETPAPAQYPTAQDIMGEAGAYGKEQFPLAYGARETGLGRLGEMSPGKEYWEGFGPTSFEEALGSQYFKNVMPEITKSIMHQQSLAGTAESPITGELIADQARKAGVDVGTYLSNLGQQRGELALQGTQRGILSQLGMDPASTTTPYAGLMQGQGNLQSSENYQNALLRAKSQYMSNIGKEQEKGAKIGSLSSIGGGILGGVLGGQPGGMDWTQGAGIGATLANILSPLWGGSGQSGGIGQTLSTMGGYKPNAQPNTGTVQPVDMLKQYGLEF